MNADADRVGFHVAFSDHEHGVDFHLLGALDFAVDLVGAFVDFCGLGQGSELTMKEGVCGEFVIGGGCCEPQPAGQP
jgi:hypothetical protein